MIGKLDEFQIDRILCTQTYGHLGCHADGKTYVVPISYVYDEGRLLSYTQVGMKIEMMRKNPEVCFQVDILENPANWQSAIVWGTFRELKGLESEEAIRLLQRRLHPFQQSSTAPPKHGLDKTHPGMSVGITPVAFEIVVSEMSGRFER